MPFLNKTITGKSEICKKIYQKKYFSNYPQRWKKQVIVIVDNEKQRQMFKTGKEKITYKASDRFMRRIVPDQGGISS